MNKQKIVFQKMVLSKLDMLMSKMRKQKAVLRCLLKNQLCVDQ